MCGRPVSFKPRGMSTLVVLLIAAPMLGRCAPCELQLGEEQVDVEREEQLRIQAKEHFIMLAKTQRQHHSALQVSRFGHGKTHACLRAEFLVNADLPKHLQVGLFAKPSQRYEAWARFSHSVGEQCCASDHVSHHAGLAVKLIDVDGKKVPTPEHDLEKTTMDLVMHSSTPETPWPWSDAAGMIGSIVGTNKDPMVDELMGKLNAYAMNHSSFLEMIFAAQPMGFGEGAAARLFIMPDENAEIVKGNRSNLDYYREALKAQLQEESFDLGVYVQMQRDACAHSVEDARRPWPRDTAPLERAGTLRLLSQETLSVSSMFLCEKMGFSPWHTLVEHRPLGSLNRLRKDAYYHAQRQRRIENGQCSATPQSTDDLFKEDEMCRLDSTSGFYSSYRSAVLIYHGVSMFIIWGLIIPVGIAIARYCKFIASWQEIHQDIMSMSAASTWIFALMSLVYMTFDSTENKVSVTSSLARVMPNHHHKIGVAMTLLVAMQIVAGIYGRFGTRGEDSTERIRTAHKYSGKFILFASYGQMILGVREIKASSQIWTCFYVWGAVTASIIIVLEYWMYTRDERAVRTRFYNTVSALQPQSSNKSIVSNLMGRYLTKPNTFVHGGALGRTSRMDDEDTEEEQSEANTLQAPSDFQSPSVSNVHAGAAGGDRVAATDPTKTSTLQASNLQKMSNQADAASDGNNVATQLWVDNSGPWEEGSMRMQRRGSQESGFTEHVSVSRTVSHDMSGAYARFLQQRQMSMTRSDSISRSQAGSGRMAANSVASACSTPPASTIDESAAAGAPPTIVVEGGVGWDPSSAGMQRDPTLSKGIPRSVDSDAILTDAKYKADCTRQVSSTLPRVVPNGSGSNSQAVKQEGDGELPPLKSALKNPMRVKPPAKADASPVHMTAPVLEKQDSSLKYTHEQFEKLRKLLQRSSEDMEHLREAEPTSTVEGETGNGAPRLSSDSCNTHRLQECMRDLQSLLQKGTDPQQ